MLSKTSGLPTVAAWLHWSVLRHTTLLIWAIVFPLVSGALIDLPALWRVGSVTWLGILVVAQALVAIGAIVAAHRNLAPHLALLWPMAALLAWCVASSAWWRPFPDALPNALAYLLFGTMVTAGALVAAQNARRAECAINSAIRLFDVVGIAIAALSFARFGFDIHSWPVHPRALALAALIPFCWHLAAWARGQSLAIIPAAAWLAAIVVSLSRMATGAAVAAILLTILLQRRGGGLLPRARPTILLLLVAGALTAVAAVPDFRERVVEKQDRTPIWRRVASSAQRAPFLGQGPGSSQRWGVLRYWWTRPPENPPAGIPRYRYSQYWVPHPHNEYLRVWHDLGIPGISLLLLALGSWLKALIRGTRDGGPGTPDRTLSLAGLLMLVVLLLTMLTDNPLVYPFIVAPAGVLIGAGLGSARAARLSDAAGPQLRQATNNRRRSSQGRPELSRG